MSGMRVGIPLLALSENYSKLSLGFVVASFAILPAILALKFGRMTDRLGYHLPSFLSATMALTGTLLLVLSQDLWAMIIAASFCGAGSGFGMIAIQRTASRLTSSSAERVRVFSWVALAPALGGLLGPLLAGSIIDHWGFRAAFLSLAAFPVMSILCAAFVPREAIAHPIKGTKTVPESSLELLRDLPLRRILLINLVVVASWDAHGFALPILGHERHFSATAIGAVFAAYSSATLLVRLILPFVSQYLPKRYLLIGSLSIVGGIFSLYPFLPSVWMLMIGAAIFGCVLGVVTPIIMTFLHESAPPHRQGEVLALRSMLNQTSLTVLPLLYGVVGGLSGAATMFWVMSAALFMAAWQSRYFSYQVAEPQHKTASVN
ncbi:MFS transporter [Pseudomaricurvus hydrocarbonicus]